MTFNTRALRHEYWNKNFCSLILKVKKMCPLPKNHHMETYFCRRCGNWRRIHASTGIGRLSTSTGIHNRNHVGSYLWHNMHVNLQHTLSMFEPFAYKSRCGIFHILYPRFNEEELWKAHLYDSGNYYRKQREVFWSFGQWL